MPGSPQDKKPQDELENWNLDRTVDPFVMVRGQMVKRGGSWVNWDGSVSSTDGSTFRVSALSPDASTFRVSALGVNIADISNSDADDFRVSSFSQDAGTLHISAKSNDGALLRVSAIQTDAVNQNISAKSGDAGTLHVSSFIDSGSVSARSLDADQLRVSAFSDDANTFHVSAIQGDADSLRISAFSQDGGTNRVSAVQVDAVNQNVSAKSDDAALMRVSSFDGIPAQQTAFGEASVAEPTPVVQLQFAYNINTRIVEKKENNSGTIIQSDDHAVIASGASSSSGSTMQSIQPVKYNTGQGGLVRFTAKFSAGVTNNTRGIGVGDESDGYFFGYNGTAFGILRRQKGSPNIQTLTVGTASSDVDTITITLDDNAQSTVSVTDSGDKTITAQEIAAASYDDIGAGWTARAVGDKVIFVSWDAEAKAGAFTLSEATSAVGTFAETVVGVAPTDTWTAQASWNIDVMDGTGVSGITLDQTKGNVYEIRYQWLGYGAITFSIENPTTGMFQLVHRIEFANTNTSPSISNPTLPLCVFSLNTSSTTSSTISTGSIAGFVEGKEALLGTLFAASNEFAIGNVTTEEPIITIRVKEVHAGRLNRIRAQLTFIAEVSAMETVKTTTVFRAYVGATPTNGTSYSDVDANNSAMEVDISATDFVGGELQSTFLLGQTDREILQLSDIENFLVAGTTFMITAQPSKAHANNEVAVSLNWKELF